MPSEPAFFPTEGDFRRWLEANQITAPELLVGLWKKGSGKPSIDWPQARDQALCFGWIDGIRRSLGDEAYTIRFTPRRKGGIWSKVNVERFDALKAARQMTRAGARTFEEKVRIGVYAYEKPLTEFTSDEEAKFRANAGAWADWEKRAPSYRKVVVHWITSAKKSETRARRLATLIQDSEAGRKIARYDTGPKKEG